MSESQWQKQGATLSHKNACKEFCLTEDEVFEAMKAGKLQYRQNVAHGNPYFQITGSLGFLVDTIFMNCIFNNQ